MTKPASKKIALNRETLRVLATVDLGRVAGGIDLGGAGSPFEPAGYTWAK